MAAISAAARMVMLGTVNPAFQAVVRTQTVPQSKIKRVYCLRVSTASVNKALCSTIRLIALMLTSAKQNLVMKMRVVRTIQVATSVLAIPAFQQMDHYVRMITSVYLVSILARKNQYVLIPREVLVVLAYSASIIMGLHAPTRMNVLLVLIIAILMPNVRISLEVSVAIANMVMSETGLHALT